MLVLVMMLSLSLSLRARALSRFSNGPVEACAKFRVQGPSLGPGSEQRECVYVRETENETETEIETETETESQSQGRFGCHTF